MSDAVSSTGEARLSCMSNTTTATNRQPFLTPGKRAQYKRRSEQTNDRVNDLVSAYLENGRCLDLSGAMQRRGLVDASGRLTEAGRKAAVAIINHRPVREAPSRKDLAYEADKAAECLQDNADASARQLARLRNRQ